MSQRYPRGQHFVKKTFHQFFTTDTIRWFEDRGVSLKTESDGRMFPVTDSSQSIIDCLLKEAALFRVAVRMKAEVTDIRAGEGGFTLHLASGETLAATYVCVAAGGYPKTSLFQWLGRLGHSIAEPVPSLFTFNLPKHSITQLMGVAVEHVRVKIEGSKLAEEGPLLITHWGMSGPAILRLSAWGARILAATGYHFTAHLNWLPSHNEGTLKNVFQQLRATAGHKKTANPVFPGLPARLWQYLLEQSGISREQRLGELSGKAENTLIRMLTDYVVEVRGKTTFKEEFVTAGGIALGEVDARTMSSRIVPNLFFAGEVLDVDGITGGFNFQHAWTSGWIAAKNRFRTQ